ncbi:TIGR03089 family protein [Aquipuribacter sp. SD81]|uniref:TIGR03089 family protein n=1 Tax=Aquipuribacter sp. SD81 TaxID=3127703 RepID=UPI00301A9049
MSAPTPVPAPVDVPRLLHLLRVEPQPRLTWVSRDGERVELSGRVLVNWVAKTANLLGTDCGVGPHDVLRTALGPAWRAPVMWLAAWHLGLEVAAHGAGDVPADADADVWVVPEGADAPGGTPDVLVVPHAALAPAAADTRVGSHGWVDYAAEVRLHPDALPPGEAAAAAARAGEVRASGGARRLLDPEAGPEDVLGVWADGGSVVWHDGLGDDALERLAAQEHATP